MTTMARLAGSAAARAGPRSTREAASMLARYTARKRAVGSITSDEVLTSPSPSSVIKSKTASAIEASSSGAVLRRHDLCGVRLAAPANLHHIRSAPMEYALNDQSVISTAATDAAD